MTTGRQRANAVDLISGLTVSGSFVTVPGGNYLLVAECATWNGAALTLQAKGPNGTAITVTGVSLSANGMFPVEVSDGAEIKGILTGTPSAALYARLERVTS